MTDTALLELDGLRKSFGGIVVVDDLTLAVGPDEALGLVGPNGAGKTTVFNLVAGDLQPDAGTVRFDGVDITAMRADRRCRAGIGRTAQVPRPYAGMTVLENVLVGAVFGTGARRSERAALGPALGALEQAGLAGRANAVAGSLGLLDRKRLELARALATQPRLLLLDEIAGGLTEAEMVELVDTIRGIRRQGVAVVWVEHIVHALLAVVDRMVAMSFGRKIAEGEPREVMASRVVQEVYLGAVPA
ncbi:MAG TPA: ABC transporter ATP-binding protein [Acidimicrobiales bacterium]|nr:ABC transporter ATP-binding protein [Acidimicrobiales bacterium]